MMEMHWFDFGRNRIGSYIVQIVRITTVFSMSLLCSITNVQE